MPNEDSHEWTLLCIVPNHIEASIIEGKLKERGINVFIQKEAAGTIYGLTSGPLAEAKIFVPYNQKTEAEKALASS